MDRQTNKRRRKARALHKHTQANKTDVVTIKTDGVISMATQTRQGKYTFEVKRKYNRKKLNTKQEVYKSNRTSK